MAWTSKGSLKGDTGAAGSSASSPALPPAYALPPAPKASRFHVFPPFGTGSTLSVATNILYGVPFAVQAVPGITPVGVAITPSTANGAGTLRAALYAMDDGLEPAAVSYDLGSLSPATTGIKYFPNVPTFGVGWWVVALAAIDTATTVRSINGLNGSMTPAFSTPAGTTQNGVAFTRTGFTLAADAWPATFAPNGTAVNAPRIELVF